jgi:P27 family predicted phage terminase small subunit
MIVPGLDRAGLLSQADLASVVLMLEHFVSTHKAYQDIQRTGLVVPATTDGIEKKSPAEAIMRLQSAYFLDYAKQLGMTWMARARTPAAPRAEEEDGANPFGSEATGS